MTHRHDRHFSVPEAEQMLARFRARIERMVELARTLSAHGFDVHSGHYRPGYHPDRSGPYPPEMRELSHIVHELQEAGILVKGIEEGLVDLPHIRVNGEEVYLCWKAGEPRLAYWHPLDTGFAGRRPLDEL